MLDEFDPFVFMDADEYSAQQSEDHEQAVPCMACSLRGRGKPRSSLRNLVIPKQALKEMYQPVGLSMNGPIIGKGRAQILRERMLRSMSPIGSVETNSRSTPGSSKSEERRPGPDTMSKQHFVSKNTSENSSEQGLESISKPPQGNEEPFFEDFDMKFPKAISSNAPLKTADDRNSEKYGDRYQSIRTGRGRSSGTAKPFTVDSLFKESILTFEPNQPLESKSIYNNVESSVQQNNQRKCKFGGAKPEPCQVWSQELALRCEREDEKKYMLELSSEEDDEVDDDSDPGYVIPEKYRSNSEHEDIFWTQVRKGTTLEDFIKPKLPKGKRKKLAKKKFEFPEYDAKMAAIKAGQISRADDFMSYDFMTTSHEPAPEVQSKHDFPDLDPAANPNFGENCRSDRNPRKEWITPKQDFRAHEEFPSLSASEKPKVKARSQPNPLQTNMKAKNKDLTCQRPPVFKKTVKMPLDEVEEEKFQAPPPNKDMNIRNVASLLGDNDRYRTESRTHGNDAKFPTKTNRNFSHTLYLENLPETVDEETIHALLSQYGEVQFCQLKYSPVGTMKAEVQLDSEDAVEWAVSCMNGEDAVLAGEGQRITCYRHTG